MSTEVASGGDFVGMGYEGVRSLGRVSFRLEMKFRWYLELCVYGEGLEGVFFLIRLRVFRDVLLW